MESVVDVLFLVLVKSAVWNASNIRVWHHLRLGILVKVSKIVNIGLGPIQILVSDLIWRSGPTPNRNTQIYHMHNLEWRHALEHERAFHNKWYKVGYAFLIFQAPQKHTKLYPMSWSRIIQSEWNESRFHCVQVKLFPSSKLSVMIDLFYCWDGWADCWASGNSL